MVLALEGVSSKILVLVPKLQLTVEEYGGNILYLGNYLIVTKNAEVNISLLSEG